MNQKKINQVLKKKRIEENKYKKGEEINWIEFWCPVAHDHYPMEEF